MDGRVKHESGHVNAEVGGAGLDDGALHVDLDEAGGSDLAIHHAERVDQEVLCVLADSGRNVVVDTWKIMKMLRVAYIHISLFWSLGTKGLKDVRFRDIPCVQPCISTNL